MTTANQASCDTLVLRPGHVSLAELRRLSAGGVLLTLDPAALAGMLAAQATVQTIVDEDQVVYGINTGFGKLASTKIAHDHLADLQRNLVLSHSVGTGEPLPDPVVRMVLATKAVSLARGHSGVRPALVDALLALANADVLPVIPAKGSVGASGDLAPLAHLACVLIGEGQAKVKGQIVSGREAMAAVGLAPFVLGPKEGLALLNGTQVSTALALAGLFQAESVFAAGDDLAIDLGLAFADEHAGHVGQGCQVARGADRALGRDHGQHVGIGQGQQRIDQGRAHARVAARQAHGLGGQHHAHHWVGQGIARSDAVREH